jgi:hypothetical protein
LQIGVGAEVNVAAEHAGPGESDFYGAFHEWVELRGEF